MKLFTPVLVTTLLAFAIVPCAHAQEKSADSSATQAKLKEMEDAWGKAFMDKDHGAAAVEPMIADDFAGFNPKGEKRDKTQLLDEMRKQTEQATSFTNDSVDVHVYGPNFATVVGTSTEKGKDKNGKAYSHSYCWVDTWMERNGKWECIAESVIELPKKK
jgi:hypothetical protein